MGVHVTEVDGLGLVAKAKDGTTTRYDARTVLWTAGVEAVPFATTVARALGVEPDRQGRIPVQPDLTVAGHPEIRVVGDVMTLAGLPGLAEVAMQSGAHAGREIAKTIDDPYRKGEPFRYRDLGSAAYISRGDAILRAGPLHLSGVPGWLAWARSTSPSSPVSATGWPRRSAGSPRCSCNAGASARSSRSSTVAPHPWTDDRPTLSSTSRLAWGAVLRQPEGDLADGVDTGVHVIDGLGQALPERAVRHGQCSVEP